ncbi:MAG: transposon-transfer assisting family protein [Oscillospiraceae bacterium]|nr:transposon-transfer assisting family protein [Oscillospiraceae bacterium]
MKFTVEEINFICVYDTSNRGRLLTGIRESLPHLLEPELKELALRVMRRLEAMTDQEFTTLVLAPDFE